MRQQNVRGSGGRDGLKFNGLPVQITSTFLSGEGVKVCEKWVETGKRCGWGGRAVGLDIEYRPEYRAGFQNKNPVALLQLAYLDSERSEWICLLLHCRRNVGMIPPSLSKILADARIRKAGVGVVEDCAKIETDLKKDVRGFVEIADACATAQIKHDDTPSLKNFCRTILGVELDKPRSVTMSNWENVPLQPAQVKYAALDAVVGAAMLREIDKRTKVKVEGSVLSPRSFMEERKAHTRAMKAQREREKVRRNREQALLEQEKTQPSTADTVTTAPRKRNSAEPSTLDDTSQRAKRSKADAHKRAKKHVVSKQVVANKKRKQPDAEPRIVKLFLSVPLHIDHGRNNKRARLSNNKALLGNHKTQKRPGNRKVSGKSGKSHAHSKLQTHAKSQHIRLKPKKK